ncbi:Rpp14/Pop5 family protein [Phaeobacter sp. SYSU ZJ3003]|uniref:Rpp14/Pop5 family protein n=1 Tax=Phaeobacter sp. SYSU ZJ3003 TaxID=2109330 RepID=UPI00351C305E
MQPGCRGWRQCLNRCGGCWGLSSLSILARVIRSKARSSSGVLRKSRRACRKAWKALHLCRVVRRRPFKKPILCSRKDTWRRVR